MIKDKDINFPGDLPKLSRRRFLTLGVEALGTLGLTTLFGGCTTNRQPAPSQKSGCSPPECGSFTPPGI